MISIFRDIGQHVYVPRKAGYKTHDGFIVRLGPSRYISGRYFFRIYDDKIHLLQNRRVLYTFVPAERGFYGMTASPVAIIIIASFIHRLTGYNPEDRHFGGTWEDLPTMIGRCIRASWNIDVWFDRDHDPVSLRQVLETQPRRRAR